MTAESSPIPVDEIEIHFEQIITFQPQWNLPMESFESAGIFDVS